MVFLSNGTRIDSSIRTSNRTAALYAARAAHDGIEEITKENCE